MLEVDSDDEVFTEPVVAAAQVTIYRQPCLFHRALHSGVRPVCFTLPAGQDQARAGARGGAAAAHRPRVRTNLLRCRVFRDRSFGYRQCHLRCPAC
jgi:hypothetical protein